jgi:hypothetical protein
MSISTLEEPHAADIAAQSRLVGQRFKFSWRPELTSRELADIYERAGRARIAAGISPRRFARLGAAELGALASAAGLTLGEARLAQELVRATWAVRHLSSFAHHLALVRDTRQRRRH